MKREPGYYWVKFSQHEQWEIGKWDDFEEKWILIGDYYKFHEGSFTEIDERRITRDPVIAEDVLPEDHDIKVFVNEIPTSEFKLASELPSFIATVRGFPKEVVAVEKYCSCGQEYHIKQYCKVCDNDE